MQHAPPGVDPGPSFGRTIGTAAWKGLMAGLGGAVVLGVLTSLVLAFAQVPETGWTEPFQFLPAVLVFATVIAIGLGSFFGLITGLILGVLKQQRVAPILGGVAALVIPFIFIFSLLQDGSTVVVAAVLAVSAPLFVSVGYRSGRWFVRNTRA